MRVVLNVDSLAKPSGGIGRYTYHLLRGLSERLLVDDSSCFINNRFINCQQTLDMYERGSDSPPDAGASRYRELVRSVPYVYSFYTSYKNFFFRRQVSNAPNTVYHEPNYILKPFCGTSVATIHDLSHIHYPECHPTERVRFLEKHLDETLSRASHIITDSAFVKQELVELLGAEAEKITAIPLGVSSEFHPRSPEALGQCLSEFGLKPGSYLLSVATLEPRKNIEGVLDAYAKLEKRLRQRYPLVLVGVFGWRNGDLKKRIDVLADRGEVIYLGHVSESDLPLVYAGARGFVYIPLYEGFGLPPLEAIASGIPAVVSNVSSIPEVVGCDALLVDPLNVDAVTVQLEKLLEDDQWRGGAIEAGLIRSRTFSWNTTVDKTVDIYHSICE